MITNRNADPYITYTSNYIAYENGKSIFFINGNDFPYHPNIFVKNGDKSKPFEYKGYGINGYRYEVPSPPLGSVLGKRKLDSSTSSYTIEIYFDLKQKPIVSQPFYYVSPTINTVDPNEYYPVSNGRVITINGNNFLLNDYDAKPTVRFEGFGAPIQLNVIKVGNTKITCNLPDVMALSSYSVVVTSYTGLDSSHLVSFYYVMPSIVSIYPDHTVSTTETSIQIKVDSLFDLSTIAVSANFDNGAQCTNLLGDEYSQTLTCTTPIVDVVPGQYIQPRLFLSIGGNMIESLFIFYHPLISSITPKYGPPNGGTKIVVSGRQLAEVINVYIGGVLCNVDRESVDPDRFTCTTGLMDMKDKTSISNKVQVDIGKGVFYAPDTELFTYYIPTITAISPIQIVNKGTWKVTVTGTQFFVDNKVKISPNKLYTPAATSNDKTLYFDVDATKFDSIGEFDLLVKSSGTDSATVKFKVVKPELSAVSPMKGYLFSDTKMTLTVKDFPLGLSADDLVKNIEIKVGTKLCTNLVQINPTTLTCLVPAGTTNKEEDISFFIQKVEYKTTLKFTYFEPVVTTQTQSSKILVGGGSLTIDGTNLDVVESVKIDTNIVLTGCTIQVAQIICTIPQHLPGSFSVVLFVKDTKNVYHEYNTGTQISYEGPTITQVSPKQGSKMLQYTITLTGTGYGTDSTLITVDVGGTDCGSIELVSTTELNCKISSILTVGMYSIIVRVKPDSGSAAVESIDLKTFTSNDISCLGLPNADDNSNSPVDWWFIYKLHYGGNDPYLYIDSTMTTLTKQTGLQGSNTVLSPIQATFNQYNVYNYLFFNDQPCSRHSNGAKDNTDTRSASFGEHGHLKGMVIFDNLDSSGNSAGFHIHHSNPAVPSYTAKKKSDYNNFDKGVKFLGNPDFNQHYFCYNYNDLDHVMEYMSRNDGILLEQFRVFAGIKSWTQTQQNRYPYLYDFLKPHMGLNARVPTINSPPLTYQNVLKTNCDRKIATYTNLLNECYWISPLRMIANGRLKAHYFMKIGTKTVNPSFPSVKKPRPVTMNKYIVKKETKNPTYDGIDLWMVVADFFNKKMFVESFYKGKSQMAPTEQVLNVAWLEPPSKFVTKTGIAPNYVFSEFAYSGRNNEHAKMGWPMYPAYGDQSTDDNQNYFCVGDSNRHNGQAERGGGILCFQHPTLVYQFNRMVRHYNSYTAAGYMTHPSQKNSIELFINIAQPIKVSRPNTWSNDVKVEVKDYITHHYSKFPPEIHNINSLSLANAYDLISEFGALRSSNTFTASAGESTSVGAGTMPDLDIMNYYSNDVMSLHYYAYDQQHASVCDYVLGITDCDDSNARTTIMTKVVPLLYIQPDFPPIYDCAYGILRPVYTYDLTNHNDFQLIEFTSQFKTKLPANGLVQNYKYVVDTANNILTTRFQPPIIIRLREALCKEEIAYFMTLQHIYYQSSDISNIIFNIGPDNPNWANGIILAISKKLVNELTGGNGAFDGCMNSIFSDFGNIATYLDDKSMDSISNDKIVRRSASAAWDWMNNEYADGNGGKINRANADIIPVTELINLMISVKKSDLVTSMEGLATFIGSTYNTPTNFQTILEKNYIIKPPPPKVEVKKDESGDIIMTLKLPNFYSARNLQSLSFSDYSLTPLVQNELEIDESGVQQLISSSYNSMNESNIIALSDYELEKLELAIDKWVTINNQSQAIQTLILDPMNQYHDQPILFIEEFNRDQDGNQIDLGYQSVGTTGTQISISSPLSIASITFILESIIISQSIGRKQYGDFEIYYLPKSDYYNGDISSDYSGMIISTVNSQLCDIKMISESDYIAGNFDSICSGSGPFITSVDKLFGSTSGGYPITLNGIRFNSSMTVSIGDNQCDNTTLVSSEQLICIVPNGVGIQNEIKLSTTQTYFNLQRTIFLFNYDQPTIVSFEPSTISSYGNDLLTIYGSNFGEDFTKVKVLINGDMECSPVLSVSSGHIVCLTPSSIGDHLSLEVFIDSQSTILNLDSIQASQNFSFSGPSIVGISPQGGDPNDEITILGEGFTFSDDENSASSIIPFIYIDDNLVEIINFTNQEIVFTLDYDTSSQPLVLQVGDQSFTTEFEFYTPFILEFNNSAVSTTGSLIQLPGLGFGISSSDLEFTLNGEELECNTFNEFIECYIPAGIGSNYTIAGSISNQTVDFGDDYLISYSSPSVSSFSINNEHNTLEIFGENFVPVDLGVQYDISSSFVNLIYEDHNQTCTSFLSSTFISCQLSDDISSTLLSFQISVASQKSEIISVTTN